LIGVLDDEDRARFVYAEVCRRAEREIVRFSWSCTLRVWLYAVARGELRARRRRRRQSSPPSFAPDAIRPLARRASVSRAVASLRRALPEEDRELLILRVDRRFGWRDIARTGLCDRATDNELADETAKLEARMAAVLHHLEIAASSIV
jgi:DNA-directed RNA polymerase specialized sigma24 family protein